MVWSYLGVSIHSTPEMVGMPIFASSNFVWPQRKCWNKDSWVAKLRRHEATVMGHLNGVLTGILLLSVEEGDEEFHDDPTGQYLFICWSLSGVATPRRYLRLWLAWCFSSISWCVNAWPQPGWPQTNRRRCRWSWRNRGSYVGRELGKGWRPKS